MAVDETILSRKNTKKNPILKFGANCSSRKEVNVKENFMHPSQLLGVCKKGQERENWDRHIKMRYLYLRSILQERTERLCRNLTLTAHFYRTYEFFFHDK